MLAGEKSGIQRGLHPGTGENYGVPK